MKDDVRQYLEEVVSTLKHQLTQRRPQLWEARLLAGAQRLLNTHEPAPKDDDLVTDFHHD
jgi:hypothetical protein